MKAWLTVVSYIVALSLLSACGQELGGFYTPGQPVHDETSTTTTTSTTSTSTSTSTSTTSGGTPRGVSTTGNTTSGTLICHIPPGNHANAHDITVGESAVPAHLKHGDHRGHCENDGH